MSQAEQPASQATFYVAVGAADTYWRVESPARVLDARVCKIPEQIATRALRQPNDDTPFRWRVQPDGLFSYPEHEGAAAVWTRPCPVRAGHSMAMRQQGILTVAEVDDNYLSPSHLNLFMRVNGYGPAQRADHLRAMTCFDRIVFSTVWLRDEYVKAFRRELRGWPVPDLFVCGNHANLEDWPEPIPPREDGRLRIGWMGSPQHARDIKLAYRALAWARAEGHEVILVGHDVRDEEGVTHPRALEACRAWREVITTHIPWIDPAEYHRTAQPFDIGVAPLELNRHTLGKSDCKAIEYIMSGAVPLLQNHPVYSRHWRHRETAMLANSPAEFELMLRELVGDAGLRSEILAGGTEYVRTQRTMQIQGVREWSEAVQPSA